MRDSGGGGDRFGHNLHLITISVSNVCLPKVAFKKELIIHTKLTDIYLGFRINNNEWCQIFVYFS